MKILKLDFSTFFQLQNSFHVITTFLGPFPAKFKIFDIFTSAGGLGGTFMKNFENLIFQFFFNFKTRFRPKQHVWDHLQPIAKFSISDQI